MNKALEIAKLRRVIAQRGSKYFFPVIGKNSFKEDVETGEFITVAGLYHESQGYVSTDKEDAGETKLKPQSFLTCVVDDLGTLSEGMTTIILGKKYRVLDIRDVGKLGIVAEVSLEVVLSGV